MQQYKNIFSHEVKSLTVKKDIVLVVGGQLSHKVVLKSLGTEPQVEYDHTRDMNIQG